MVIRERNLANEPISFFTFIFQYYIQELSFIYRSQEISSHLISSHFISYHIISFYHILSHKILSHLIPSHFISSRFTLSYLTNIAISCAYSLSYLFLIEGYILRDPGHQESENAL